MKSLTIGQVAERSGVGVETVRFYERKGLIPEPPRSASGYRQFDAGTVARLQSIQRAKRLGFTLEEIKELFSLRSEPASRCADVKQRAEAKIDDIDERIRSLERMRTALVALADECSGQGSTDGCPILAAVDPQDML